MRHTGWTGLALAGLMAFAGTVGWAEGEGQEPYGRGRGPRGCSVATLRGVYGIQLQGTRPSAPNGPIETVIGVVWREYDGEGGFRQIDNVKGAISGVALDRPGFGTYTVNEDCTGETSFQPGPGMVLVERLVLVDGGREIRSIVTSPQPVMVSSVQTRLAAAPGR